MTLPTTPNRRGHGARALIAVLAGAAGLLAGVEAPAETAAAPASAAAAASDGAAELVSSMDPGADPCTDFYRYACGGWLASTELPSDQVRWARSFSVIRERNREIVRGLLEAAAAEPGTDPDRQKIGAFYASCMDTGAIETAGTAPLQPLLEEIAAAAAAADRRRELMALVGRFHRAEIEAFFGVGVIPDFADPDLSILTIEQGGLGLPERDYYLSDDEAQVEIRAAYERYVADLLGLLGADAETAAAGAAAVLELETRLAEASRPRAELRDVERLYHKLDREGLEKLVPLVAWDAYLEGLGRPAVTDINIETPEFFIHLEKLLRDTDPATLTTYLRFHAASSAAPLLPDRFVQAHFGFYGKTLSGQQEIEPRWKRCVDASEGALGEAVGKLYVAEHFAGDSKQVALEMIHDIEEAFASSLPRLAWMDDATRARALDKRNAITNKIGYPDRWRDYSALAVGGGFFANALAATRFESDRQLAQVGGPVDPDEWLMTPQMVNAYYHPLHNEIAFPAGILQPPFFDRDFPAAMNYGAVGAVMGHELTHGFDDQGRKFDPEGRMHEWWEPQVSARFDERAQCVDDAYSAYEVEPGLAVNGRLTLGENIADIGGVKQAWMAYQGWTERHGEPDLDLPHGLTDDRLFFIAYSQVWCALATPEDERVRVRTDSHSPPRFRSFVPLVHNPAFAETFDCPAGAPMNPPDRCEVW